MFTGTVSEVDPARAPYVKHVAYVDGDDEWGYFQGGSFHTEDDVHAVRSVNAPAASQPPPGPQPPAQPQSQLATPTGAGSHQQAVQPPQQPGNGAAAAPQAAAVAGEDPEPATTAAAVAATTVRSKAGRAAAGAAVDAPPAKRLRQEAPGLESAAAAAVPAPSQPEAAPRAPTATTADATAAGASPLPAEGGHTALGEHPYPVLDIAQCSVPLMLIQSFSAEMAFPVPRPSGTWESPPASQQHGGSPSAGELPILRLPSPEREPAARGASPPWLLPDPAGMCSLLPELAPPPKCSPPQPVPAPRTQQAAGAAAGPNSPAEPASRPLVGLGALRAQQAGGLASTPCSQPLDASRGTSAAAAGGSAGGRGAGRLQEPRRDAAEVRSPPSVGAVQRPRSGGRPGRSGWQPSSRMIAAMPGELPPGPPAAAPHLLLTAAAAAAGAGPGPAAPPAAGAPASAPGDATTPAPALDSGRTPAVAAAVAAARAAANSHAKRRKLPVKLASLAMQAPPRAPQGGTAPAAAAAKEKAPLPDASAAPEVPSAATANGKKTSPVAAGMPPPSKPHTEDPAAREATPSCLVKAEQTSRPVEAPALNSHTAAAAAAAAVQLGAPDVSTGAATKRKAAALDDSRQAPGVAAALKTEPAATAHTARRKAPVKAEVAADGEPVTGGGPPKPALAAEEGIPPPVRPAAASEPRPKAAPQPRSKAAAAHVMTPKAGDVKAIPLPRVKVAGTLAAALAAAPVAAPAAGEAKAAAVQQASAVPVLGAAAKQRLVPSSPEWGAVARPAKKQTQIGLRVFSAPGPVSGPAAASELSGETGPACCLCPSWMNA